MKAPPIARGLGHNVRHFYPRVGVDHGADTALCALAVYHLEDGYETLSGSGPFCPSCMRVMSKTLDLPVPSQNQIYWFWAGITVAGFALLALGIAIGQLH